MEQTSHNIVHQNAYRDALMTAQAELGKVAEDFKQLQIKKARLERVIQTLSPLVDPGEIHAEPGTQPNTDSVQHDSEPSFGKFGPGSESPADEMQRRINYALGSAVA
jgi:hypothetical protein